MDKGSLTPRSADVVADMRFTGGFGQPDGFASVLLVLVRMSGEICLTLNYRKGFNETMEGGWSIELTNEQRKELARLITSYDPVLFEPINHPLGGE